MSYAAPRHFSQWSRSAFLSATRPLQTAERTFVRRSIRQRHVCVRQGRSIPDRLFAGTCGTKIHSLRQSRRRCPSRCLGRTFFALRPKRSCMRSSTLRKHQRKSRPLLQRSPWSLLELDCVENDIAVRRQRVDAHDAQLCTVFAFNDVCDGRCEALRRHQAV